MYSQDDSRKLRHETYARLALLNEPKQNKTKQNKNNTIQIESLLYLQSVSIGEFKRKQCSLQLHERT